MDEKKQTLQVWNGPTFRKPRLPRGLSWVIGVERLSERFADIPQFTMTKVWFDDHPVEGASRITVAKAVAGNLPLQVLTVWYTGRGDPEWFFMVYPVEASRRSHVRQLIEEHAFPVIERWMKIERPRFWLQSDRYLRCTWDRTADGITIKEADR